MPGFLDFSDADPNDPYPDPHFSHLHVYSSSTDDLPSHISTKGMLALFNRSASRPGTAEEEDEKEEGGSGISAEERKRREKHAKGIDEEMKKFGEQTQEDAPERKAEEVDIKSTK